MTTYTAIIESITSNYATVILSEPLNKSAWLELDRDSRRIAQDCFTEGVPVTFQGELNGVQITNLGGFKRYEEGN